MSLPRRSRTQRRRELVGATAVVFGKKGTNVVFTVDHAHSPEVVSVEQALPLFAATADEEGYPVSDDFLNVFTLAKDRLFAKSELPPIRGRRAKAVSVLTALGNSLPEASAYCKDLVTVIRTLDDISDGTLKAIARLDLRNRSAAYQRLEALVPREFTQNVFERVTKEQGQREFLLLAEEFA